MTTKLKLECSKEFKLPQNELSNLQQGVSKLIDITNTPKALN